jgi:hypothetical protein
MVYGTIDKQVCLDLETGNMIGYHKFNSPPSNKNFTITPTQKAQDQFDYFDSLSFMASTINTIRNGNPWPPRDIPPQPQVAPIKEYVDKVSQEQIKLVGGVLQVLFPYNLEFDRETGISIKYQVKETSDIVISSFDAQQQYPEIRRTVQAGPLTDFYTAFKPDAGVTDPSTFIIQVSVVPQGLGNKDAYATFQATPIFLKRDRVNWVSCSWKPKLGTNLSCYLRTTTSKPRQLSVELVQNGQVLRKDTRDSNETTEWVTLLEPSWTPGAYQVVLKVLGDNSEVLDEKTEELEVVQ